MRGVEIFRLEKHSILQEDAAVVLGTRRLAVRYQLHIKEEQRQTDLSRINPRLGNFERVD